jgi:glycosyltransferase involved in cell wall biosynthesis
MKVVILTPGTGNFYCGATIRDSSLARGLRAAGHDAVLVPLYLPLVIDEAPVGPAMPLFLGGINMFLQHKVPALGKCPRILMKHLDHWGLLRFASQFMGMTRIRDLGTMTVDSYRGLEGNQRSEWLRLLKWLKGEDPDVVILSNGLLAGVASGIREVLPDTVKVIVTLQGEDSFLDTLPEPYRSESWAAFRQSASFVDHFVAVSEYCKGRMAAALELPAGRILRIYAAIDTERYPVRGARPMVPAIGFLARQCKGKGLDTLVDAFIEVRRRGVHAQLSITGTSTRADKKFLASLKAKLGEAGFSDAVRFTSNITFQEKIEFLHHLSVLSVPATYGEAFGLYTAEAMACGVPLVQPRHGPFPEIVEGTGGGLLVDPDDVGALADAFQELLGDATFQDRLSRRARQGAIEKFDLSHMVSEHLALFG